MKAYISLGANIGDRFSQLEDAVRMLQSLGDTDVTNHSSYYETKPVGVTDQPDFLNAVVEIETNLAPLDLLEQTQAIEQELGRIRTKKWGPRTIDLDILLYEDENIELESLIIPHPRMLERGFVMLPLAEVAPELQLEDGRTAAEAARAFAGDSGIVKAEKSR
ncbi:2-amino-4-hydroxy-6-hydroxymethyldihydropteridine diphosphokinase [Alkalicoccus luteus]|uniref:2-amino-4-hydroxy-6-hydroxymethyldihydropteridine diphosphokinase n=1 Tax=Alkalicoccus luteus TaxID=1237094 RepID=A0A969PRZ2_9BACI|nr:2-amino-4-hydroxy-6-hydroxymethyldihydropteridine diphosphokinase [Alkalicoccus luteus]